VSDLISMSQLGNYCVCTSLPANYSPLHDAVMTSVDGLVCASETSKESNAQAEMTQDGGRKSILFELLNVRVSSSPALSQLDEDRDRTSEFGMKLLPSVDDAAYRTRSDSFNSAASCGMMAVSRTPSGGSLASSADREVSGHSEALVEATLSRLGELSTNGDPALLSATSRSRSQPGTPPSPGLCPEMRRKYSMGSRLARLQQPTIAELIPVDLSCKRSRYDPNGTDTDDSSTSEPSILKSILTVSASRERSNTLSVCGTRGLARQAHRQQHVALAKKTLLPVTARVAELMKRSVEFAFSLPEFMSLSPSDRQSLLASALPRLVTLYMAEKNLQFAVTPAHESDHMPMDCDQLLPSSDRLAELPTQQFVEGVQNLIRKCQLLQINANEFFYMRMITLFHTGLVDFMLKQVYSLWQTLCYVVILHYILNCLEIFSKLLKICHYHTLVYICFIQLKITLNLHIFVSYGFVKHWSDICLSICLFLFYSNFSVPSVCQYTCWCYLVRSANLPEGLYIFSLYIVSCIN